MGLVLLWAACGCCLPAAGPPGLPPAAAGSTRRPLRTFPCSLPPLAAWLSAPCGCSFWRGSWGWTVRASHGCVGRPGVQGRRARLQRMLPQGPPPQLQPAALRPPLRCCSRDPCAPPALQVLVAQPDTLGRALPRLRHNVAVMTGQVGLSADQVRRCAPRPSPPPCLRPVPGVPLLHAPCAWALPCCPVCAAPPQPQPHVPPALPWQAGAGQPGRAALGSQRPHICRQAAVPSGGAGGEQGRGGAGRARATAGCGGCGWLAAAARHGSAPRHRAACSLPAA